MKSHELAKLLLENPDTELIIEKDAEGNGYSPLEGIEFDVVYVQNTTYSGNVYSKNNTAEDNCMGKSTWDELQRTNSGYAVLYPVN